MSFHLLPESATAPPPAQRRYLWRSTLAGAVIVAAMLVLEADQGGGLFRGAVFLCLMLGLGAGAYEYFQLLRALDEMQRRIHIGALALSGAFVAGAATLLGLAAMAFQFNAPMAVFVGPAFGLGYYAALMVVSRHYT
jgi:hypothetical protein